MSSSYFYGPSGAVSPADASGDAAAGSYRVCDTVVLVCLACASSVIILTVAICFRRAFADGYAAAAAVGASGAVAGRRGGLASSALEVLPKLAYRRVAGAGLAQCSICIAVVRDGETVRQLPACGHLFHVDCIDLWLRSQATCPLCRRDVVGEAPPTEKV